MQAGMSINFASFRGTQQLKYMLETGHGLANVLGLKIKRKSVKNLLLAQWLDKKMYAVTALEEFEVIIMRLMKPIIRVLIFNEFPLNWSLEMWRKEFQRPQFSALFSIQWWPVNLKRWLIGEYRNCLHQNLGEESITCITNQKYVML